MTDKKDITNDFLLCNRCGACRAVCPVFDVYREEWAAARGKVEVAEAFFRGGSAGDESAGGPISDPEILKVFDMCLHCLSCEENCPSGMRADEIVLAVKAEMARRGLMPKLKAAALSMMRSMDAGVFRAMRRLGLVRREKLHGYGRGSAFGFLFPLIGWPSDRSVPLPAPKAFLGNNPGFFPASRLEGALAGCVNATDAEKSAAEKLVAKDAVATKKNAAEGPPAAEKPLAEGSLSGQKRRSLLDLARRARNENIEKGTSVYYFIGHTVNHFFPEEAEALVWVLNLLGVDVLVPRDQECCGAPYFYAGDIENARAAAALATDRIAGHKFDWIVTSCASGGRMLKEEFPRLFDLSSDGFFKIGWDPVNEVFVREKEKSDVSRKYREAGEKYRAGIDGKIVDINELLAVFLGLGKKESGYETFFSPGRGEEPRPAEDAKNGIPSASAEPSLPVVTYHHPCHLNRGQGVGWQPEAILELLPGYRYVRMPDAERCCGGGGAFTFTHSKVSEKVAALKMDAVASVSPDIVATSCPICRIQLMDMLRKRFVLEAGGEGVETKKIAVWTPVELLSEELREALNDRSEVAGGARKVR